MRIQESVMKTLDPAGKRLGFQIHALVFVLAMLLQVSINLWTGPPYWVLWVVLGWGIGLLSHWWFVVGPGVRRVNPPNAITRAQ
jgi:hypothetical protein